MKIEDITALNKHPGSHDTIDVWCGLSVSPKCKNKYRLQYRKALEWAKANGGKLICLYCSRASKFSGRNNPNAKYKIDDDFLATIDTELKAYILGWIASDGSIGKNNRMVVQIHQKDVSILEKMRDAAFPQLPIKHYLFKRQVALCISSKKMCEDVCSHLKIQPGAKYDVIKFPELSTDALSWAFLRGYFDGDGCVTMTSARFPAPRCGITSSSPHMLEAIKDFTKIPCSISRDQLEWSGTSALDFLGKLYGNASIFLERKYQKYINLATWVPGLSGTGNHGKVDGIIWCKADKNAVAPFKARVSDSGYDLTIIKKVKQVGETEFYDTGIKVLPPYGYYFDLVPRSSLAKTGYILMNSVGIIDRSYTGSILVPLLRIDHTFKSLELPARVVQLIPRQIAHFELNEVEKLDETSRSDKGFGSSGK